MHQSMNPTAQQSQRWIIKAFLDLLEIEEYNRISVSGICRRADLDRRTFYRNFDSKQDVLEHYVHTLGEEYMKGYAAIGNLDSYSAAKYFFEFWSKYLLFLRNMKKCGLSNYIFQQFEQYTTEHMELLKGTQAQSLPRNYVLAYRVGGFWNVMLTWIAEDEMLPPEELAFIITQI